MIRAAFLLTLVFTLGPGAGLTLVCQALCDRTAPEVAEMCHHTDSATQPIVTTSVDCAAVGLPATAAIREDTPRLRLSIPGAANAVPVLTVPGTAASAYDLAARGAQPSPVTAPRTIALRI